MKKGTKKHPLQVWRLDGDDLKQTPFNTAIWLYFNMKPTATKTDMLLLLNNYTDSVDSRSIRINILINHIERIVSNIEEIELNEYLSGRISELNETIFFVQSEMDALDNQTKSVGEAIAIGGSK
ncbi:hypothetical protein [Fructobacillus ficulneus]|uniref:Uncharacterized protein n=1 Tax=Fructobacillus ficulneus TaxID=157463 RepID=A0A0K8MFC7_9LACO|nr:hypothetical protein [Fructobacillus ficulneus]GAO99215.1 hypothetical protein FFIC_090390 [Fructobacillus ficulneus]